MLKFSLIGLTFLSVSLAFGFNAYRGELQRPLTEKARVFEIKRGDSLSRVAERLRDQKLLETTFWFKLTAFAQGVSNQLKAGEYAVGAGVTLQQLLDLLVKGSVQQHALLLVEGWNLSQVLNAVCVHPAIVKTICSQKNPELTEVLGSSDRHPEGRFFPDTYFLTKGTTDVDFLKRAAQRMRRILAIEWQYRSKDLPLISADEALVLASIIEKETGVPDERDEISGVFIRRLQKGMLLQSDPTVIYGLGEDFDGNLRSRDLLADTPYNTYVRAGLPPTPIAMPGIASIHAALHPKYGDALYFVARGNGRHYFSATLSEHNRAVREYQLNKN